jgi:integrase/recombinase XerD
VPVGEWYLAEVRPSLVVEPDDGTLFLSDGGQAFHLQYFSGKVRRYVKASGVHKPGGCHLIRHTVATLMLDGGADIRFVQHMLGHAEISTTQIYTQVAVKSLQEVYRRSHPAARLERQAASPAAGEDGAEELLAALTEEEDADGELDGDEGEGG